MVAESTGQANAKLLETIEQLNREIEARKKAEEQLKVQQKLLRDIIELVPVGVWVIDKDGNKVVGNKMVKTIWEGIRYEGTIDLEHYKGWWTSTGVQLNPEEWASYRAIKKGETSLSEEITIECFDGSQKTILNSAVPIFKDQCVDGAIIVNVDITELKQVQEKNALNARLFDMTNDAIFSTDENLIITAWNKGAEKVYGWTDEEVIGKNARDIVRSQISEETRKEIFEEIKLRKKSIFEINQFTKEGRKIVAEISSLPLFDNYGKHTGFLNVNRDITDKKRVEELYRATFEQAAVGIAQVSLNGNFLKANKKLSLITGYEIEELQTLTFQDITFPEDLDRDLQYAARLLSGEIQTYQMEKRYIRKDKTVVWANLTASIVKDEFGNPNYFIALIEDINSKKKAEQMLQLTLDELRRSNKDLAQFAYVASHDLQEPLRMISGYLSLLSRRYSEKFDSTAKTYMDFAVEGAKRMSELIKDLLTYSKLSAKINPFEKIDVGEIISEVINDLSGIINENKAEIIYCKMPIVYADRFQLKQLLLNLIDNAVKFCHEATPVININVERKGKEWLFSVRDNGIGIEEEYFEKIFLIFQRLHSRDKYPGTGVGLTMCKKIVEQHKGKIWVESEPEKGSVFYFTIPCD